MSGPREQEIDALEKQLEDGDLTDEEKRAIHRDLRDIERDFADEEQWREQGYERGWTSY
jgi:hypothetical protein